MNPFGWVYLILTIIGSLIIINEIGKPRKPRTAPEVITQLMISALLFWGLFVWGLR